MTENNNQTVEELLSYFVNQGFSEPQVQEIALGLEAKLPITIYAKQCYNWMQMREIRLGLAGHLDTQHYRNPLFSANQMREIRIGLKFCVDVSKYANLMLSVTDMRRTRHKLMKEAYKKDNSRFAGVIFDEESQIDIRISDNSMNVYITIPETSSKGYKVFDLIKLLKNYAIVYGVELQKQNRKLNTFYDDFTEIISDIIEFRDTNSGLHVKRVKGLTKIMAQTYMQLYPEH